MRLSALAMAAVLALAGCSGAEVGGSGPSPSSAPSSGATSASPAAASSTASGAAPSSTTRAPAPPKPSATPSKPPHPVSIQALIQTKYNGSRLRVGRQLDQTDAYKRYLVTYRSEDLKVSGVMLVPDGKGPFPVLVLAHGYINPDTYFPGQGMPREHDYLARQGYVVLHTDYRGHASGDDDPDVNYKLQLPYAVDVINAALAVKDSDLPYLDKNRIGLLGRSMGGNVALNAIVAQPGLFDAAVIYASVSSRVADNWRQWYEDNPDRQGTNRRIARTYGLPDDSPEFWRAASSRTYFDRVTTPLQVHHGAQDDTCPISWSRATVAALEKAGKEVDFRIYPGEGHTFEAQWRRSIIRTDRFFERHLRA